MKKIKLEIIFLIISFISLIVINYYPTGDWMSAPLLILFIIFPLMIIQILLMVVLLILKHNKLILGIQGIISIFCLILMLYYIFNR